MPRKPKSRLIIEPKTKPNSLLSAIQFVASILKDTGSPQETHLYLSQHSCTAFNGVLAAGIYIEEDLHCCPHAILLERALSKCGQNLSITQLDNYRLSIKSDKFKAVIPCLDNVLSITMPDPSVGPCTDEFRVAIESVGVLAVENAQRVVEASILNTGNSVIASNGKVIFEYYHGLELPIGLTFPKALIKPLSEIKKKLISYGNGKSSVTFYFEDGSWLRSQLFAEPWPAISHILDRECNPFPIPEYLWEGLAAVAPFSEAGDVWLNPGRLASHAGEGIGASFDVPGLPGGAIYPTRQLALLKPWAERADFIAPGPHGTTCLMAYGSKMRGIIAGKS